jgi:hypothetical protein
LRIAAVASLRFLAPSTGNAEGREAPHDLLGEGLNPRVVEVAGAHGLGGDVLHHAHLHPDGLQVLEARRPGGLGDGVAPHEEPARLEDAPRRAEERRSSSVMTSPWSVTWVSQTATMSATSFSMGRWVASARVATSLPR